jgi:energy-coupling factor transporter ATP-binding protein EcfA2
MTSSVDLKSLTLSAFRGSSTEFTIEFEKGKKLTLIYGENGTGKTTICDAFEFLAAERIGSLEDRGMGKGLEKFWPTAGKAPKDLSVKLETNVGVCFGQIVNKKVAITPPSAKPRIELLRRQQVLRLIEARPADRYNEIKRFIDIAAFETSEEALRQLGKSLSSDKNQAEISEIESLATLHGFFDAAGKPAGLNPVSWAKKKLAVPASSLDADIVAIGKLRTSFEALAAFPDRISASRDSIAAVKAALEAADNALAAAIALASDGAGEFLALLEAGQTYLHAHPAATECPLCGSAEKSEGLANAVKVRLDHLGVLKETGAECKKQRAALSYAEAARQQIEVDFAKAVAAFSAAQSGHSWQTDVALPAGAAPGEMAALADWLVASAPAAASWPEKEASWRDERKFVAALQSAVQQYDSNHTRRMELQGLVAKVEEALTLCVAERQAFTDGVIKAIAQEVGKLYEAVHPGEGLDAIALPLDPDKRASLELTAKFSGQEAPPQAYFSQSHLDTLGLCVFLALALRHRPEETTLILDDVLGSVDEPHVERVIHLIYSISGKFRHTIVTTHYRPWREKYRWGWLKAQPCQFIELAGWGLEDGIRVMNSPPEIERLNSLLAAASPDPQAVCSKAGVILEAALDHLTQKYECMVPRRPGSAYTLGDLLPAVGGKLRAALKVKIRDAKDESGAPISKIVELKPILDELERIAQTRNAMGAHFKAISFEMLDADALGFGKQVVLLWEALTHPVDGWPGNDKSGSYWKNSGDTRRLHPLKKPQ